jgi:hypothetical protein
MYNWSLLNNNSAAVQIAYQAESAFRTELEREEEKRVEELKARREQLKEEEKQKAKSPQKELDFETQKLGFYLSAIAVPLATLGKDSNIRQIIRSTLPKVLNQDISTRKEMLDKYRSDGREKVAIALERALRWKKYQKVVTICGFMALIAILVSLYSKLSV